MSAMVLHLPLISWLFLDKHKELVRRTSNPTQMNNWARNPNCSFSQSKPFTLAKTFNLKTDLNLTREYKIRWTNSLMLKVSQQVWCIIVPSKWIWPLKLQQANLQIFIWLVRKMMDNAIHITKTDWTILTVLVSLHILKLEGAKIRCQSHSIFYEKQASNLNYGTY